MMRCSTLPTRLARTGCSVLALATALAVGASPAAAQSFLGAGTYATNPNVTGITTGPGTTTINLNAGQTVIDWVPTDNALGGGPINFQLGGTTATFTGASDFAVLNNINQVDMGRVISMNGTINSLVGGVPGGSVYFYSAGGFVLGPNSLINVGSLVLSASPITLVGGNFITGASNSTVTFGQALRPGASITTDSGSRINATAGNAYVAMVAPRVQHGGTITVNGSAALVGAEAATIDFSPDGLFDIQVTVGTTDSEGVFTNGNITGSASTGTGDARRAFLVAVPKNTALTMAISNGADLGFQIAGAANVSDNAVILSAGHDIVDGEVGAVSAGSVPGTLANISSVGLSATSAVRATATNFAEFYGGAGEANSFASDLTIRGPGRAWLSTFGTGSSIAIANDLVLNSDRIATIAGGSATGGSAFLYTGDNGAITVGRDATVTANGSGSGSSTAGIAGGAGTGGSAGIQNQAAGGTISIVRNALVSANGTGGGGLVADANGGAGSGGFATIRSYANGTSLTIGGTATAQAMGTGGSALGCATCFGGVGSGGFLLADVQLGSTLSVTGMLRLNADGRGGSRAFGRGGTIDIQTGANSSLTAGSLNASADGFGGADVGAGAGNGTGGTARLIANGTGATIAISNIVTSGSFNERDFVSVEGRGGQTNGGGSGIGGTGQGGSALIQGLAGGSIALPNTADPVGVRVMVRGYGGNASADGTTGGLGAAGNLNLSFDNGTFTAGPLHLSAAGLGGFASEAGNITGGNGLGGTRNVTAINGSTLSFAVFGGVSGGGGGDGAGTGNGGNASGGFASLLVDNSTVNFTSRTNLITQNQGGIGATGGNGAGGTSSVTIRNGGVVNVADDPSSDIDLVIGTFSYGNTGATGNGGNAAAGSTTLNLQGGTINLTGRLLVGSEAYGGTASTSGTGGSAIGGTVNANATGANNAIAGAGTATFSTDAYGGFSATGTGGNATGGTTHLVANSGASLSIASSAVVTATGFGGGGGTAGGGGFGGTARILANSGSSLSIGGLASIEADGRGGGDDESDGNGGFGNGGLAVVSSAGGAISLTNVDVRAAATGGSAFNGLGGGALGGTARLAANGGSISVTGDVTVTASATGGTGSTGGTATALISTMNESTPAAVALYANTGGSLTINGKASLDGRATGGRGFNGNGGNAFAGEADVVAFVGGINVGNLSIDVNGQGGTGGNGGNGGSGQGGQVDVAFGLDTPAIDGTIKLGSATISADGLGGNGGNGLDNNFGGNGGAGGAGAGGGILFVGSAAGGTLDSGTAILTARGTGGRGGAGGNGDSGTGGNGGAGGAGTGNLIQAGTVSQNLSPGSGGAGKFTTLSINTSATGGNGGSGGLGGGGNGAGGSGGNSAGGTSDFLIRGVLGTANSVTLFANATGGNGGTGSVAGNGGNARTGFILVESKDRFEVPAQRGTLIANSIVGTATAIGGSGATPGTSTVMNGSYFRVLNGDANIGTVSITLSGILNDSTFGPSFVSVRDGTATTGSFSFVTNGTLALDANNGSMRAGSIALNAANFVPHTANSAPTNIGTYFGNSATITTGNNFVTNANLDIRSNLAIAAPGLINARNFTVAGNLTLSAGISEIVSADGSITAGTIEADDFVELYAGGNITAGTIDAGSYIDVFSNTGLLNLGDLHAGTEIDLETDGSLLFGDVTADDFNFEIGGSVDGGNINAVTHADGHADGAMVLKDITVTGPPSVDDDFSIGFTSATSIKVGNVNGYDWVGFASAGDLTTGNITAGSLFLALAGGSIVTGSITTDPGGRVYIGNESMCGEGCGDDDEDDNEVEAADILALDPVPTGGSILIDGTVNTGLFQAAAGTSLTSGAIDAGGRVELSSGGAMQLKDVTAGSSMRLTSGAALESEHLTAGSLIEISAAGAVDVGDIIIEGGIEALDVGPGTPVELFGASISTGDISTDGYVGLYTPGDLSVGTINAGHDVIALVGDDSSFGAITTPERFFLGGYEMFALVTGGEGFNPEAVFAAEEKSSTGGSASFAGSSSASTFEAYVGDDTTLASLQTANFADIDTGGLFTLNGALKGDSSVVSNDIAIGANGSVSNGYLRLISRNSTQTLVGDGLDGLGQGYRLSDAEADRILTAFSIAADTSYGAAAKMIIGDLSIAVPGSSENEYEYEFETINRDSDDPSVGSIRVVGDVVFNNIGDGEVSFDTNLFELDAATGSISLFNTGTTLGGELALYAPRIWVASGDILAKLEANATYTGYIAELNAPAAVQRPEGVLRAASLSIGGEDEPLQSLLVQNTGTKDIPAGFLITESSLDGDDEESSTPPGSVNLVINGQIITQTGTLTGVAVRDLLVTEVGTTEFAPGSTINGCPLTGTCQTEQPRVVTPTSTDVALSGSDGLGDGSFGNEADIDDGESGDEGDKSSPIAPPNPLFDSRPLTDSADIDDPVSGSGNPSLYGSPEEPGGVGGSEDDDDEDDEDNKKKAKRGDGK